MRKVILGVAITVDGYIEGPNGEYDWCFTDQDYGMTPFLEHVDAMLVGRKSYDVLRASESSDAAQRQFPGVHRYVFSNTLTSDPPGATLVSGDIASAVHRIRQTPGKDIWLFGGAELFRGMLKAGQVDTLWLAMHPILLGSGTQLFNILPARVQLKLTDARSYDTGLVSLRYDIVRTATKK